LFVKHYIPLLFVAYILSGCGFRPQYSYSTSQKGDYDFSRVEIPIIKDRYGQMLRNSITNFVGEENRNNSKFVYSIQLNTSHRDLGFEKNLNTSRSEVVLLANYTFSDKNNKGMKVQGYCRTSEYYSLSKTQIFQSVSAEKNAPIKGLETLSRCLIDRLVILMKSRQDIRSENQ
jgi:hypothetical protein